jgi:hypothetical protein
MCEPSDLLLGFKRGIEKLASNIYPGKHNKTKAQILLEVMQDHQLFGGDAAVSLKTTANDYIRNLFRPWKVVKAGDTSPVGAFKTSTIEVLHKVINAGNDRLFPSLKAVGKAKKLLDEEAVRIIGYECKQTQYGEVYFINYNKALRLLLKASGLCELATTESVNIAFAIDGADLIRDRTHVSAGVKITDPRGIHPVTKQPLLMRTNDDEEKYVKVQSFELCALMIIANARDTKALYEDVYKDFYDWGKKISSEGLPDENGEPELRPFNLTHNSDMKAAWYLSNRGGGCKTTEFFCTLCSCTRDKLVSFNVGEARCDHCKQ